MFLSIIIPVFNAEKYLEECLDSCLAQNYPKDDYEILCIDDGSTDCSGDILDRYVAENVNVTVIKKENGGVSSARNLGLEHAKGEYIWFVDADDFIQSNVINYLKEKISYQYSNPDIIKFPIYEFSEVLTIDELKKKETGNLPINTIYGDSIVWNGLFNRKFLVKNKLKFRTNIKYGEDSLFGFEARIRTVNEYNLDDRVLYFYRRNPLSVTRQSNYQAIFTKAYSYYQAALIVNEYLKEEREKNGCVSTVIADELMIDLRKCLDRVIQLNDSDRRTLLKELKDSGLFPFNQPKECSFTLQQFANEKNGKGKIRNILRFYSIYPWGLYLSTVPYKANRAKIKLSRALRSNDIMNKLLDAKNRLLRR